jgi:hypothetical protein
MSADLQFPQRAPSPVRPKGPPPLPRPNWFDFLLILVGCALSLLLTDLSGFRALPGESTPGWLTEPLQRVPPGATLDVVPAPSQRTLLNLLPYLLFLPLGILLLWPLFYFKQRLGGRTQGPTAGEWLWGLTWLGAVLLTVWVLWQGLGSVPEFLSPEKVKKGIFVGYAVGVLALGGVALLTGLVDLIARWPRPWTHHFVIALLIWPALILGTLLLWGIGMI